MLTEYVSFAACTQFKDQLDHASQLLCEPLLAGNKHCDEAFIKAIVLPDDYIGPRDRPYKIDKIEDRVGHMNTTLKGYFQGH
jgi:hypothetical protein